MNIMRYLNRGGGTASSPVPIVSRNCNANLIRITSNRWVCRCCQKFSAGETGILLIFLFLLAVRKQGGLGK